MEIAAWLSSFDYSASDGPGPTEELHVSCALSEESAAIAKALMKEWMRKDIELKTMETTIRDALALIADV